MKTLYVLRHGIAVELGSHGVTADSRRPLTPKGRKKVREIAEAMRRLEVRFDLLLTSPLVRARQTAEIVVDVFKARRRLRESDALAIGGNTKILLKQLRQEFRQAEDLLVVGHEPCLSEMISVLLTGTPDVSLVLKKGGLCKLVLTEVRHGRCAALEWLLPPRVMIR